MPAIAPLALRYLIWLIGLRMLYAGAAYLLDIPDAAATAVILASVPAMDIGIQAMRRATRPLSLPDWAQIWGVMVAIYVVVSVVVPAILIQAIRAGLATSAGIGFIAIVTAATALMLALFLWIGVRTAGRGATRG